MNIILDIKNILLEYRNKSFIEYINFIVHKEEIFVIIVPNWAGKTCLLQIMAGLENFRQEHGTTIVMVSHDLNLASMYCGRLLLLKEGRVVKIGTPKTVLDQTVLQDSYGCQMLVDKNPVGGVARVTPIPQKFMEKY